MKMVYAEHESGRKEESLVARHVVQGRVGIHACR